MINYTSVKNLLISGRVKLVFLLLIPAAMLCMSGCSQNKSLGTKIKQSDGTYRNEPRVIINSKEVEKSLAIDSINTRTEHDMMQVETKVRNLTSKRVALVYRYAWLDYDGFEVESAGDGWKEAWIEGYQTKGLDSTAPNEKVKDFRLEIQDKK